MKITIQELSKSFGGRDIFNNFSLEVDSGVRLCVCGPNGTGKSTFLRLLAGVEPADGGRVILPRGCRLGFVEQELSEEALDTPLLTYVLDVLHDWNEFWAEWEEAAQQKDEARLTQLMHRQAELEATHGYNPEHRAKAVLSGALSVRQTEALVKRLSAEKKEAQAKDPDEVDYLAEAQNELKARLCRGVKIVPGRKKGRIELEYYGVDDLNDLLDALAVIKVSQLKKGPHA